MKLPQKIRILDIDDIYIIYLLGHGVKKTKIAEIFKVNYTTIRHRLKKIEHVFETIFVKTENNRELTEEGKEICDICKVFLDTVLKYSDDGQKIIM